MAMTFNGNEIENANYIVTDIDHYSIPKKDIDIFALSYANKSAITTVDYPSKMIKVTGYIRCDDTYSLGAYIDIYKSYLSAKDANLDIDFNSTTRRYIATANKVDIKRSLSRNYATVAVDFICPEPFGVETSSTSFGTEANWTAATKTFQDAINGTAPIQYPIITITIDALTGTGDYIQISNNANGQEMLLYGLGFAASDVLVIDCFERTVTVNGVAVDYLGAFLELTLGENDITYADGFDTRTVDIDIDYYKRYL